jgi:hypothetical protein
MRIAHEILSVFLDLGNQEITILLGGLRLSLTPADTTNLVATLLAGLERLKANNPNSCDEEGKMIQIGRLLEGGWEVPSFGNPSQSQSKLLQSVDDDNQHHDQRRARIKAKIRDKGLSLGEGVS